MNTVVKKTLIWTGAVIAVLIVVLVGTVAWVLNTQSGTRFAAARATAALGDKLGIGSIDGIDRRSAAHRPICAITIRRPASMPTSRSFDLDLVLSDSVAFAGSCEEPGHQRHRCADDGADRAAA